MSLFLLYIDKKEEQLKRTKTQAGEGEKKIAYPSSPVGSIPPT